MLLWLVQVLYLAPIVKQLLGLLAFSYLAYRFWQWKKNAEYINQLPGPPTTLLAGNCMDLDVSSDEVTKLLSHVYPERYGRLYRLWLGTTMPTVVACKASVVEPILTSSKSLNKSSDYKDLHDWLGYGLLTSTGSRWHNRRKLLTPTFHMQVLEGFLRAFHTQGKIFMEQLQTASDEMPKGFDIFPYATRYTLDVICETAMGRVLGAQVNKESDYVKAVANISKIIMGRAHRPWLRNKYLFRLFKEGREHDQYLQVLHGFTRNVIAEKKAEWEANKEARMDGRKTSKSYRAALMDLLLMANAEGANLSDEDIREEVDTFMFAGHDTTGVGIAWCLYLLGRSPEVQQMVFDEVSEVIGFKDDNKEITMDDLNKMRYLECVIKETQRIYPSVPLIGRELTEDVVLDGHKIPSGNMVFVLIDALHYDPEVFPDPEVFDPDRFLPDNSRHRSPFAYVPFSAGPRNCIGQKFALMQMKYAVALTVRHFQFTSLHTPDEMRPAAELILRPTIGVHVELTPRKA